MSWRTTLENLSGWGWLGLVLGAIALLYGVAWTIERVFHYYKPTRAPQLRRPAPKGSKKG